MRLFDETTSYIRGIRIEEVRGGRTRLNRQHLATTLGLTVQSPTVRFVDSLGKEERIEAIGHELGHILLVYRFGLGVIGRRSPRLGSNQDIFDFFLNLNKYWDYFLGQLINTIHHQILSGYLKEEYGIESGLHLTLLHRNFRIIAENMYRDKESLYAKGLVAFEYEKLMGKMDRLINPYRQPEFFWRAYHRAQKHFGSYHFKAIPTLSTYEENVLSYLEDLGYRKRDFMFFPSSP